MDVSERPFNSGPDGRKNPDAPGKAESGWKKTGGEVRAEAGRESREAEREGRLFRLVAHEGGAEGSIYERV